MLKIEARHLDHDHGKILDEENHEEWQNRDSVPEYSYHLLKVCGEFDFKCGGSEAPR